MRAVTRNSVFYVPEPTPADAQELPAYIARELEKIRIAVDMLALGHLDKTHVAPAKPREGDIRLADGADWNPGSGAGFYGYYGGAWAKLG